VEFIFSILMQGRTYCIIYWPLLMARILHARFKEQQSWKMPTKAASRTKVAHRAFRLQSATDAWRDMKDWLDVGMECMEQITGERRCAVRRDGPSARLALSVPTRKPLFQPTEYIRYPTWQPEVRA